MCIWDGEMVSRLEVYVDPEELLLWEERLCDIAGEVR